MVIYVEPMLDPPPGERQVEVVEHKGLGHPDTICDALAEEVSRALCRHYVERFGRVLHHNVDKALLVGGSAQPRFGGGAVTEPIEIDLAGRVTRQFQGAEIPVEVLAIEASRRWLQAHLHALDAERHVRIRCRFRPGSADLVQVFGAGARVPLANDTSFGVGFAPRTPLEEAVLRVARALVEAAHGPAPEIGEDIKIMGVREGRRARLTVACALVSAQVADASDYLAKKAGIGERARQAAAPLLGEVEVVVNAADDPAQGTFYLTVTGTSAEAGDDGQVGRGNRVSGLITPGRPMTLEAAAGKNPVSHVGKLYNVLCAQIAGQIAGAGLGVDAVECQLTSRIGAPIDQPQAAQVRVRVKRGTAEEVAPAIEAIVRAGLQDLPRLSERIIAGEVPLY